MLKCRDIPSEAEKLLAGELPFGERVSVRMHLFICHNCRRYVRQLKVLLGALNQFDNSENHRKVSQSEAEAIVQRATDNVGPPQQPLN
ncbi:MAG: zf-HC2 domain-containing protein [Alcanivoracaceae bacterium]|nr:zf-HC2 domain-containing protein [Alcanivoracaceae bacterium]